MAVDYWRLSGAEALIIDSKKQIANIKYKLNLINLLNLVNPINLLTYKYDRMNN